MRNDKELKDEGANPDALDHAKLEYAHQVVGALQSHPALRKFARQIADIPLDASTLRAAFPGSAGDIKGVIAVEAAAPGGSAPAAPSALALFTAFELRSAGTALFEPCPEADFGGAPLPSTTEVGAALPLRDGFVEPQAYGATRRFQIASIDGIAAYYSRKRSEDATRKAYLSRRGSEERADRAHGVPDARADAARSRRGENGRGGGEAAGVDREGQDPLRRGPCRRLPRRCGRAERHRVPVVRAQGRVSRTGRPG